MSDDNKDKFREARELFERSKETFDEGHREGMDALAGSEGREQSDRLDGAIDTEQRAIEQMDEALELMGEAINEQRGSLGLEEEDSAPPE